MKDFVFVDNIGMICLIKVARHGSFREVHGKGRKVTRAKKDSKVSRNLFVTLEASGWHQLINNNIVQTGRCCPNFKGTALKK